MQTIQDLLRVRLINVVREYSVDFCHLGTLYVLDRFVALLPPPLSLSFASGLWSHLRGRGRRSWVEAGTREGGSTRMTS